MSRNIVLMVGLIALLPGATGCTSAFMQQGQADLLAEEQPLSQTQTPGVPQQQGTYTVELRPTRAKHERVEVTFTGVPYVQQALEKGGAISKFRRMNVEIIRKTDGHVQKMRSSYDHVREQVPIEWDYALYPGDVIIVTEDPRSMFDDMVESALGPLAFLGNK
jgi:hypothetical protein